jgi:hypothetical protein
MIKSMRRSAPRYRRFAAVFLALALVGASLMSAGSFVFAKTDELNTKSIAQGHAQVVAQGMTAPPNTKSYWRAVKRSIPIRTKAQPADNLMGGAGFIVAGDRAILVIDQKYKTRTRLAPGESLFVSAGSIQTWASLDDKAASAYTLELVASGTASDIPNSKLIYADKKSFAIPEGDYVLDLVRDVLIKNEKGKLGKSSYTTLIMAMSGSISIQSDSKGAKAVTLKGGYAAAFSGNLTFKAGKDGASYVAAVIGPATGVSNVTPVTSTPTPKATKSAAKATKTPKSKATATPTPKSKKKKTATPTAAPSAQVVIGIAVCPPGIRPESGVPGLVNCSAGYGGYDLNLVAPDGTVLTLANASEVTGSYVAWTGLAPGEYQLIVQAIPPGYDSLTLDGYLCCSVNGGYALSVGDGAYVTGTMYFYQPYVAPTPVPTTAPPGNGADTGGVGDQQPAG